MTFAPYLLTRDGAVVGGLHGPGEAYRALSAIQHRVLAHAVTTKLTDSTGGTNAADGMLELPAAFITETAAGPLGADDTEVDAALVVVKANLADLYGYCQVVCGAVGVPWTRYDGSVEAVSTNTTLAAVDADITAATDAVPIATMNPIRININSALFALVDMVNNLSAACGFDQFIMRFDPTASGNALWSDPSPGSIIAVDGGTPAATGVSKIYADLAFGQWRDVMASLAFRLNAITNLYVSLTDNSTGVAATDETMVAITALANEADSGTSLAQEADSQASYGLVTDALAELFAKANEVAAQMGIAVKVYDGGQDNAADDTIAAMDATITAAATGVQATECTALDVLIQQALGDAVELTNDIATKLGASTLVNYSGHSELTTTPGTIDKTATGTAADPGIGATEMGAAFQVYENMVAVIAKKINELIVLADKPVIRATYT